MDFTYFDIEMFVNYADIGIITTVAFVHLHINRIFD